MEQKDEIQNYVNIFQNIIIVLVAGIGSIFYYWMANVTEISDNQFETMLFFAVILTSLVLIFSTLFWLFNRQLRRFK